MYLKTAEKNHSVFRFLDLAHIVKARILWYDNTEFVLEKLTGRMVRGLFLEALPEHGSSQGVSSQIGEIVI